MILIVVSTGHFDPLFDECNRLSEQFEFFGQIGSSRAVPKFPHVKTVAQSELQALMAKAELVVSHAGTGMLTMLYRLHKKTVVIPKQIRYGESNDGQVELAKKWAELGLATLCMDVGDLESAIIACRGSKIQFTPPPSLGRHLAGVLG